LGSYKKVSTKFLLQTFSKEVLAGQNKGKLHLAHKHSAEVEIVVTEDQLNLLETGAVGAFISGLEDEFMEVRSATVGNYFFQLEIFNLNTNIKKNQSVHWDYRVMNLPPDLQIF
jgi:hypothetical protein